MRNIFKSDDLHHSIYNIRCSNPGFCYRNPLIFLLTGKISKAPRALIVHNLEINKAGLFMEERKDKKWLLKKLVYGNTQIEHGK